MSESTPNPTLDNNLPEENKGLDKPRIREICPMCHIQSNTPAEGNCSNCGEYYHGGPDEKAEKNKEEGEKPTFSSESQQLLTLEQLTQEWGEEVVKATLRILNGIGTRSFLPLRGYRGDHSATSLFALQHLTTDGNGVIQYKIGSITNELPQGDQICRTINAMLVEGEGSLGIFQDILLG